VANLFLTQIMIVDWANLRKRLVNLFNDTRVKAEISKNGRIPTQILNYNFGDHVFNVLLSFFGDTNVEGFLGRNVRILIYGAWDLDSRWKRKIISYLEGESIGVSFSRKLIEDLWRKGFLYERGVRSLVSSYVGKDIEPDLRERQLIHYLENYKPFVTIRRGIISLEKLEVEKLGLEIKETDRQPDEIFLVKQKRVDMLMGIDIASYSFKLNPVEFLVLCNDQDILPALKVAKRNGAVISFCFFEEETANEILLSHADRVRLLKLTDLNQGKGKMQIMNGKVLNSRSKF